MKVEPIYQDFFFPKKKKKRKVYKTKKGGQIVRIDFSADAIVDKDILDHLDKQPNKSVYMRELIRKDLKK